MALTSMALMAKFGGAGLLFAQQAVQAQETIPQGDTRLLTIFVGLTAFALLVAAIAVVVMAYVVFKLRSEIMVHVVDIKAKALPIMDKSNVLIADLTPHIKAITGKVSEIAGSVENIAAVAREKVQEFSPAVSAAKETFLEANTTVRDANQKTKAQVDRVNSMISSTLDATAKIGATIQHGINVPAREIAGIVSGVRAGIDTLFSGARGFDSGSRPATVHPVQSVRSVTPMPARPANASAGPRMPVSADKHDLGL